jgi:uncharacterized protein YuzE
MRLHVDKEADALYLRLDDSRIIESEEVAPGVILDYNEKNEVVGGRDALLVQANAEFENDGVGYYSAISSLHHP